MIDTHTHLYFSEDYPDGDDGGCAGAVSRALQAGVDHMVFPGVSLASVEEMLALHHRFPEATSVAAGLHPTEVGDDWRAEMRAIFDRMEDEAPVAVGEVGIDLYHDSSRRTAQMDAFGMQVQEAQQRALPLIIHCRKGLDETLEILRSFGDGLPPLVFHSFTSGPEEARRILEEHEAYFGFNGVATFKNAREVREAVREVGIGRIVLETDSPYLAPVPYRGRRNESAFIREVCAVVAAECGISPAEAERITDENARRIFRISEN